MDMLMGLIGAGVAFCLFILLACGVWKLYDLFREMVGR